MDSRSPGDSTERCPPLWLVALLVPPAMCVAFTFVLPRLPEDKPFVCPPDPTVRMTDAPGTPLDPFSPSAQPSGR
jgi:hypothetical protein